MASRWAVAAFAAAIVLAPSASGWAVGGPAPDPTSPLSGAEPAGNAFDFGVRPVTAAGLPPRTRFNSELSPGQELNDRVEVINNGPVAQAFYIYAADAYTTPIGGGFAVLDRTAPKIEAAKWVTLPVPQYTVAAHSAAVIPIRVTVPADASPGDHTVGIIAEQVIPPAAATTGKSALQLIHRVGTRLYLRVRGPVHPTLSIQNLDVRPARPLVPYAFGQDKLAVSFDLVNTGNTRVQLDRVHLDVTGLAGGTLTSWTVSRPPPGTTQQDPLPDELLPGGKLRITRQFVDLPPLDKLTLHAEVDGQNKLGGGLVRARSTRGLWNFPWFVVLIALAIGGGVVGWRRWLRRREEPEAIVTVGAPDTTATVYVPTPAMD